ncbi:FadR/GntR family transcriptional regulator [Diaminobutyricibacter sp. McL0608]|uniref:FadR/GntR family transcriptional regulator n=1 Tax=Leifsonia sp. McL0608 TaxID=3143537 RepID=UPI0031F2F271
MTVADRRAWELVLSHIETQLVEGRLQPGDHLPPERALAGELDVGRSSVREAVRVLEVMGLIRTQTGSGPSSGAIIVARPNGGMQALMRLQVAASGFPVADVVRTRLLLETAVVSELAELALPGRRATGSDASTRDLSEAIELLDAMDAPSLTPEEFLVLDAQFHLALAVAADNQVVSAMMAGLRSSIEGYVRAGAERLPDWDGMASRLRDEHRTIMAAIHAGQADLARTIVHDHISGYYRDSRLTPIIASTPNHSTATDYATAPYPDRNIHHG